MIVIFVTKNDAEFNKYLNGCTPVIRAEVPYYRQTFPIAEVSDEAIETPKDTSKSDDYNPVFETPEMRQKAAVYEATLKRGSNGIPVEYMFPIDSLREHQENDVFVIVVRSGEDIVRLKEDCKRECYRGNSTKEFLSLISAVIEAAVPKWKEKQGEQDIRLLVHWGELHDPMSEEAVFNQAVEECRLSEVFSNATHGCRSLKVREISSRRPHEFFVNGEGIKVPVKKKDVDALLQRFEEASKSAGIKDVLTAFVVQGKLENESLVYEFLARDDIRKDLRAALRDKQMEWLKEWKAFRDYLDAEPGKAEPDKAGSDNEKSDKEKPDKVEEEAKKLLNEGDRSKAFVTLLLTRPQLLSEGLLA